jgi:hypothetical protein
MKTCTCVNCYETIARVDARIRSVAFRQVAYCRACWAERYPATDEIPAPRQPADDLDAADLDRLWQRH